MPVQIGEHSYGTPILRGDMAMLTIGRYVSIGDNVIFDLGWSHNIDNISQYPFHTWGLTPNNNICKGPISIGNDVWIGADTIIMSGVTIGDGAVIGARTVITKDVEPYTLVVGNNRVVRKRFAQSDIDFLLQLKWWDMPNEKVRAIAPILHSRDFDKLKGL